MPRESVPEATAARHGDTPAGFFRPDTTYQRRRWRFQCLAVAPSPFDGTILAVGFLFRPGEPATATALGQDDWELWQHGPETAPASPGRTSR
ncbi:hypothetical protein [Streptomyces albidoflavus]|uniref:hypothetical protein n=1 Tax=Streptomyces albidoflavus TaxID=1886 RepID=UPI0033C3EAF9